MIENWTAAERREIHAQLVAAKPRLSWGEGEGEGEGEKTPFICHAIAGDPPRSHEFLAVRMIEGRLRPSYTVMQWLEDQAHVWPFDCSVKDQQAYRHRWLDALIAEFAEPE